MLLVGHALCDFPLQGDFLAKGKNPWAPIPGVPWYWCMAAHAAIHAGMVGFVTGRLSCALGEFAAHFLIDVVKCEGRMTFGEDQVMHIVCKAMWAAAL